MLRPLAPNGPGTVFRLMIRRLAAGGGCDGEGRGNAEKTEQMGLSNISMVIGACGELYFFRHDLEGLQVGSKFDDRFLPGIAFALLSRIAPISHLLVSTCSIVFVSVLRSLPPCLALSASFVAPPFFPCLFPSSFLIFIIIVIVTIVIVIIICMIPRARERRQDQACEYSRVSVQVRLGQKVYTRVRACAYFCVRTCIGVRSRECTHAKSQTDTCPIHPTIS